MEIIKNRTNFDFIGKRKIAVYISTVINLAIIIGIVTVGFNMGVDFIGGTLIEVKFAERIDAASVRQGAEKGGLHELLVQGIGAAEENSFVLRMGGTTQLNEANAKAAEAAVKGLGEISYLHTDLDNGLINFRSKTKLDPAAIEKAVEDSGLPVNRVVDNNRGEVSAQGYDYQVASAGMAEKVTAALKKGLEGKAFEVRKTDYVGPQVGKQLRNKGILAVVYALIAILIYVAFRFDLKFGPGALLSMVHDIIMVAGYFLVSRREFNLTSIAVLLTIVGYSINDTIVIYDRIREEMARYKGKPLAEIINIAVNDTLSRTILTSGVTALSLVGLLIFGVGEIFDFAAAMLVGIFVGTYSSVYIASPLTIWLDEREEAKKKMAHMTPKTA